MAERQPEVLNANPQENHEYGPANRIQPSNELGVAPGERQSEGSHEIEHGPGKRNRNGDNGRADVGATGLGTSGRSSEWSFHSQ